MTATTSAASPAEAVHVCVSSEDQARHKALLRSVRTASRLGPSNSLPVLHAASVTPFTSSAPARDRATPQTSMEFLSGLDQIRIVDTHPSTRDGATLYVVEAYTLLPSTSNIPTVRNSGTPLGHLRPPQSSVSRTSTSTPVTASSSEHETPERLADLIVRRRFSDFARLRREAVAATCVNAHFLCPYCRRFQTYVRFHAGQPLWFLRVVTTRKQRMEILARFLSDLADFAQSRVPRDEHCRLRQTLAKVIEAFLSD